MVELAQAGVITLEESRELIDHPDIDAKISMYNAAAEAVENALERILDGESVTPTPYMNLQVCVTMAQNMYLKLDISEEYGGAPEEILEGLADFIAVAAGILNPPAMPQNENAPMPAPGAAPGPAAAPAQGAFAPSAYAPMTA